VWEKSYKVVLRIQARDDEGLNSSRYGKDQKEGNGDNLEGWNGEGDGIEFQVSSSRLVSAARCT